MPSVECYLDNNGKLMNESFTFNKNNNKNTTVKQQ